MDDGEERDETMRTPESSAPARTTRRRRFPVPRFGIGWIFVGMLLVISAAGWWKFHRDLYVEEVEVVRSLRKHAGKVTVRRSDLADFPPPAEEDFDRDIPWSAPLSPPIRRIYVEGELPSDVRSAVARLPRLKTLGIEPSRISGVVRIVGTSEPLDFETHLGRSLPEFPEPTLSAESESTPLPEGEEVDAEEAARIAAAIYAAWRNENVAPDRFLVVSRSTPIVGGTGAEDVVHLVEPERRYHFYERQGFQRAVHLSEEVRHDLWRQGGAWRRDSRDSEAGVERDDEVFRRFPYDEFPYLAPDFFGFLMIARAVDAMPRFDFARVAKIDDVRYRVDFRPFAAPRSERDAGSNLIDPQVTEWNFVLRSDLDWAPEESTIVQSIQQSSWNVPKQHERRSSQRYRREGEHVLLTERISRDSSGPPGSLKASELAHHLYAYEMNPEYDERIYDPLSLDSDAWPDRRELPWLRWYRVTFLLGCGLAMALVSRRTMSKREKPGEAFGSE